MLILSDSHSIPRLTHPTSLLRLFLPLYTHITTQSHTHITTHSLSLVLVVMIKPKEFKTKTSLTHSLILSFSLAPAFLLRTDQIWQVDCIILDLRHVTYIDSSGVNLLLNMRAAALHHHILFVLCDGDGDPEVASEEDQPKESFDEVALYSHAVPVFPHCDSLLPRCARLLLLCLFTLAVCLCSQLGDPDRSVSSPPLPNQTLKNCRMLICDSYFTRRQLLS